MMKKLFFLFFFCACSLLTFANVGDTIVVNDVYYYVSKEDVKGNQVEVIAHPNAETPYAGEIVLPATVENKGITYDVTRIANRAFYNCSNLTSVAMPEGLIEIGFGAFENSGLTGTLTLPSTLLYIQDYAFQNCVNLTGDLVIPDKVTTLAQYAFAGCTGIETVAFLSASITSQGAYIFRECTGIKSISINEEWSRGFGTGMFYGCTGLTKVVIPDKATSISNAMFRECTSLESVVIGSSITSINSTGAFRGCTGLKSVEIKGNALKTIGNEAFYECESLTSIDLPNSVTTLGNYVFQYCNSLTHITIPEKVKTIPYAAFSTCDNLTSVDLPAGLMLIDQYAFAYCKNLANDLVIPDSVTKINNYAFRDCLQLSSVTFGKHIKTLGSCAFYNTPNLTSVTFGDSITTIGNQAFQKSGLTSLNLPKELVTIGSSAFRECPIVEVVIPNKVKSIGESAFRECPVLASVQILDSDSASVIGNDAFRACPELVSLTLGQGVTSIGNNAFYYSTKLRGTEAGLIIPNSVTNIGSCAFYNCDSIRTLSLGNQVQTIGASAFQDCQQLGGDIVIPESVTTIGGYAFYNCDSVTSVQLGSNVTSVGAQAFYAMDKLLYPVYNDYIFACMPTKYRPTEQPTGKYDYEIPEGITTIAPYAFYSCGELGTVTIPESVTTIGDYAFRSCSWLVAADIPETTTNLGVGIFFDCDRYGQPLVIDDILVKMPNTWLQTHRKDSVYTVPDSIHRIAGHAFQKCYAVKQINIHNNITAIEENAFANCTNLRFPILSEKLFAHLPVMYKGAYTVPDGINMIVSYAFNNCTGLTAVTIPESIDTVAPNAFKNCTGLRSVQWNAVHCKDFVNANPASPFYDKRDSIRVFTFGDKVEHIPSYLCYAMDNITAVVIPNSVKSIGDYSIYSCQNLQSITVGENVTTMGYRTLGSHPNLLSVVWNVKNIADFTNDNKPLYASGENTIVSFTFGENVEHIPAHLCRHMKVLPAVTIPKSVKTIGQNAFHDCISLKDVIWNAKHGAYYTNATPFPSSAASIASLTFGEDVEHIPAYIASGLKTLTTINIPANVKSIGIGAFYNCQSLKAATLPASIKYIEPSTFYNCYSLKEMVIPEGVDTVRANAFQNCIGLTSITIPENIDSIIPSAFSGCTGMREVIWNAKNYKDAQSSGGSPLSAVRSKLISITFGDKVERIPAYLAYEASNLTSITFTKNVQEIGKHAFYNCTGLQKVNFIGEVADWCEIPFENAYANPIYYAKNLFFNDIEATDVVIPETVDTIQQYSFYNCYSIRSLTIGDNVKAIEARAFCNDTNMCVLTVGEKVDTLGADVFTGCKHLEHVTWKPKQIRNVPTGSFFASARLSIRSFVFGENVVDIPRYLVYDMDSIKTTITIPNSVKSIGYRTFYGTQISSIVLGKGLDTIANEAFVYCDKLKKTTYTGDIAGWCGIKFGSGTSNPIHYSKNLYLNDELLTHLETPASVTSIGQYAFYNCQTLESAVIGENITSIGKSAFAGCSKLIDITWNPINYPDFATNADAPFNTPRHSVASFTFGDKVEHIPAYLCYYMSKSHPITIPASVRSIGENAFQLCSFSKVHYEGTIADWCKIEFANNLANPAHVAKHLYIDNEKIQDLVIPETVTSIGQYAFSNLSGIKTVDLLHTTSPLPTVGTDGFTSTITGSATLYARCGVQEEAANTAPWSTFAKKNFFQAFVTVKTNNPAYGTARAETQPDCSGSATATLRATPATGCRFLQWHDGDKTNPRTLTGVNTDRTVTAIFVSKDEYTVHATNGNISDVNWDFAYPIDLSLCDLVVGDGVTLTCDVDTKVTNMTVTGGGKLIVPTAKTLTIGDTFTAQSEDDSQPQILTEGTGKIAYGSNKFRFVKHIPADRYYFFSLPFTSSTGGVTIDNGTGGYKNAVYNTDWNYLYYDGAGFAQNPSNESYWMDSPEGTIQPNQGYAVGVDAATADTYRDLVFKPSSTVDFSLGKAHTVAVAENPLRGDYVHPHKDTFKGWNFIMNPYTSNFGPTTGSLTIDGLEGDVMVSIPKPGQNQTYTQCLFSELGTDTELLKAGVDALEPFYGFFVQVTSDCNVVFAPHGATRAAAPSANRTAHTAPRYIGVQLSNDTHSDATTLVVGEQFTTDYEIGSDLMKMIGYGNEPQVYTYNGSTKYAFKSINEATAAQVQPMGVYLPAMGTYTFSLRDKHVAQAVYLYDYEANTVTNLAETDYTFTSGRLNSEKRFAISAAFAPSQTTALPSADATAAFTVHQDGDLHITLQGVAAGDNIRIINVHGQVVMQWTATDTTTEADLPQAGLYIIERTSAMGIQVNKIIL